MFCRLPICPLHEKYLVEEALPANVLGLGDRMKKGILFVVSGPSGGGKTTLIRELLVRLPDLNFGVSYTTRKPRPGEVEGVDYRFVSEREFREMIKQDSFAEWANVHGNLYGTPRDEIEKHIEAGRDVILDIDVQGAESIRRKYGEGVYIFVVPPSERALASRLKERHTESEREFKKRMTDFKREMEKMGRYDYIIVNDTLNVALEKLVAIVKAERARVERVMDGF